MLKKNTIPAPDYFLELWEKVIWARKEVAKMHNVSAEWYVQAKIEKLVELAEKLPKDKRKMYNRILEYGVAAQDLAWATFRLGILEENNNIADAFSLAYDEKTKSIIAKSGMREALFGMLKEIFE